MNVIGNDYKDPPIQMTLTFSVTFVAFLTLSIEQRTIAIPLCSILYSIIIAETTPKIFKLCCVVFTDVVCVCVLWCFGTVTAGVCCVVVQ
jgi:hypothetical protein